MADTTSTDYDTLVTATHHTVAMYDLRPQLFYDSLVELDNTESTHNGSSHNFNRYTDMPAQTTPLGEVADVTPVTLADLPRTVTVSEYGAAVQTSGFLRATAYMEVNPIVSEIIGFNAGLSVDTIARNRLEAAAGTTNGGVLNVVYSDAGTPIVTGTEAARNRIGLADLISAQVINYATAKLRGLSAMGFGGTTYFGVMHPDVAFDLRAAAPGNQWSDPHIYVDTSGVYNAVVGTFGGVRWMESPRASLFANASNGAGAGGNIDVYGSYVFAKQAFGKMFSKGDDYGRDPVFTSRPRIDHLERLQSKGWKHMVGYLVTREECVFRLETVSSIGVNA